MCWLWEEGRWCLDNRLAGEALVSVLAAIQELENLFQGLARFLIIPEWVEVLVESPSSLSCKIPLF